MKAAFVDFVFEDRDSIELEGCEFAIHPPPATEQELIDCLEQVAEMLLRRWLAHSRAIRISVLETLGREERWQAMKQFVERYGGELFTQQFMNLGNLRAILQQGADEFLAALEEEQVPLLLLDDLGGPISRAVSSTSAAKPGPSAPPGTRSETASAALKNHGNASA